MLAYDDDSMGYDKDAGHRKFLEDVFENENRIPGGKWMKPLTAWTDVRGDPKSPRDDIECPAGWLWFDDAWEVTCIEDTFRLYCSICWIPFGSIPC
jgi:hypothetical protein